MLAWPHSGFHVHNSVRLEADDPLGLPQLARYAARAPLPLPRLQYLPAKNVVRLTSDKPDGPTAGTHSFDALDFLALLLTHVPDFHEILAKASPSNPRERERPGWRRPSRPSGL